MKKKTREIIREAMIPEIKGLMVTINGKPNVIFDTEKEVDDFIGDVQKVIENCFKTFGIEASQEIIHSNPPKD